MAEAELDGIKLESSTDSQDDVNTALGIEPTPDDTEASAQDDQAAAEEEPQDTAADSAAAETESDDDSQDDGEQPTESRQRPRRNVQKRINELTAQRRDLERKNAELERRLAEQEQGRSAKPPDAEAKTSQGSETESETPGGSERPNEDDFDSYDDYIDAFTDWKVEQAKISLRKEIEQERRDAEEAERREAAQRSWNEKLVAARERYDDWDEVFSEAGDVTISPEVAEAIQSSDVGPDLLRHLCLHPELTDRLNQVSAIQAALEIGRLESQFQPATTTPTTSTQTQSAQTTRTQERTAPRSTTRQGTRPTPLNPVNPTTTRPVASDEDIPIEEWIKKRNAGQI